MNTYKFYIPKSGDAIEFYIKVVEKAILRNGDSVTYTKRAKDIKHSDIVFTVTTNHAIEAFLRRPKKVINWFQGVQPEELKMRNGNGVKSNILYMLFTFYEYVVLRKSSFNFLVSKTMKSYFKKKYGYDKDNYFIMPCFNEYFHEDAFTDEKYQKPTFVYTGSVTAWQCVDETVGLFSQIKKMLPNAELTIYSSEKKEMREILDKHGVQADIRYVDYKQLAKEIRNFKYGFLIRKDCAVNNVATPTKMSSYLASGIIPIFTDVIGDFKEELKDLKYSVPLDTNNNGLDKIYQIEESTTRGCDVKDDFKKVFDQYYSEDYYIDKISKVLKD